MPADSDGAHACDGRHEQHARPRGIHADRGVAHLGFNKQQCRHDHEFGRGRRAYNQRGRHDGKHLWRHSLQRFACAHGPRGQRGKQRQWQYSNPQWQQHLQRRTDDQGSSGSFTTANLASGGQFTGLTMAGVRSNWLRRSGAEASPWTTASSSWSPPSTWVTRFP